LRGQFEAGEAWKGERKGEGKMRKGNEGKGQKR